MVYSKLQDIKLYDIKAAAEILHVSSRTVGTYLREGRLHGTKIGRKWQITEENLEKFMKGEPNQSNM